MIVSRDLIHISDNFTFKNNKNGVPSLKVRGLKMVPSEGKVAFMKTVAVIPAFNEGARVREALLEIEPFVDQMVVVDDGSSDETPDILTNMPHVVSLMHAVNRGQGAALRTGTEAAIMLGADIIIHIDADGQHNPADIPRLIEAMKERNADVVFGSRFLGTDSVGMPVTRKALLSAAKQFNAFALGIPRLLTDPQSGFRAIKRMAAQQIDFHQDRMAHCSEILRLVTRSNLRWTEVPVTVRYTTDTLSKGQKPTDAFKIVWQLIIGAFH